MSHATDTLESAIGNALISGVTYVALLTAVKTVNAEDAVVFLPGELQFPICSGSRISISTSNENALPDNPPRR